MNRSWSPHIVRIMPGHGFLMQSLPPSFDDALGAVVAQNDRLDAEERPRWRCRASACARPGSGVIRMPPVSVCHQVSTIGQRSLPIIL